MFESVLPEKTFAIVVGIETYGAGLHALDGPASDALRFIEWLSAIMGVPPQNIVTHIAPLPENIAECDRRLKTAQIPAKNQLTAACAGIRQSLLSAPAQLPDGELLLLFWGGHGMYSHKEKQPFLFGGDASSDDYLGFGADDIIRFLETRQYNDGLGFNRRIAVFDACADEQQTENRETKFPLQDGGYEFGLAGAGIEKICLATLQSAALGQTARQERAGTRRTGVFSNLLLNWLNREENRQLPPDICELIAHIKLEFESRGLSQRPVFLKVGDWGDKPEIIINHLADRERMQRLRAAHEALELLGNLPLTTAELKSAYEATLSDDARDHAAADADHMLEILTKMPAREGLKINRELEFVGRVAAAGHDALRNWTMKQIKAAKQLPGDLTQFLDQEALQAGEQINHLLIDIPGGHLAKHNQIKFWFYTEAPAPECGQLENSEQMDEVRQKVLDLILEKANHPRGKLFVELYVPLDWLDYEVEQWECLSYLSKPPFLGEAHPVVVRWRDRAQCNQNMTNYGEWMKRAVKIRDQKYCPLPKTYWFESSQIAPREMEIELKNNNYGSFVSFAFAPARDSLLGMLLGGAPFAFWRRDEFDGWPRFKDLLDAVAIRGQTDALPHSIRQLRFEAKRQPEHQGAALALLWDDPSRNPLGPNFKDPAKQ